MECDRTSGGAKFFPSTVKIILVMRLARTRAQRIVSAYAQLFSVVQVDVLSRCSAPLGHAEAGSVQEVVGRRGPIGEGVVRRGMCTGVCSCTSGC